MLAKVRLPDAWKLEREKIASGNSDCKYILLVAIDTILQAVAFYRS